MSKPKRRCLGFGPYAGICENEAGTRWGPHFCERCDKLRLEHISKQFNSIITDMKQQQDIHGGELAAVIAERQGGGDWA